MYVCVYVCNACMYAIYAFMYACMHVIYVVDVMHAYIACMGVCMYVCMRGCMYLLCCIVMQCDVIYINAKSCIVMHVM